MHHGAIRRILALTGTAALCAAVGTSFAATAGSPPDDSSLGSHGDRQGPHRYEIGLFGDLPYGDYGRAHTLLSFAT